MNLQHYAGGVWGLGLRFDPAIVLPDFRATWPAIQFWLAVTLYAVVEPSRLLWAGLALWWVSPIWAIAAAGIGDPIMEYRGYGATLGLAMMFAAIVPATWLWILVALWSIESAWRSQFLKTAAAFWGRVLVENHGQGHRAHSNYARAIGLGDEP